MKRQLALFAIAWLAFAPGAAGAERAADATAPEGTKVLRIAAASDLKFALDELTRTFTAARPGFRIEVSYGSSGNWFAQLSNQAPFDMFLSADLFYPRKLAEAGLVREGSEFTYAVGHLVVWVPRDAKVDLSAEGLRALLHPSVRKIAIANPKHAPYGRAAVAALRSLELYEELEPKLVYGENVAQAAQFVQSGAADAGIIALSLARAPAMRERGRHWELPQEAVPKLEQAGVILKWTKHPQEARALREFLTSRKAEPLWRKFGFTPAEN